MISFKFGDAIQNILIERNPENKWNCSVEILYSWRNAISLLFEELLYFLEF